MTYLLDTNVLSEVLKKSPDKNVLTWLNRIPEDTLYMSVLTIGELRKGVERLSDEKRKSQIKIWLEHDLVNRFNERILSITVEVAERWGRLQADYKRPLPAIDSLLAATALHHDLTMVTRNTKDFNYSELEVLDPWQYSE